MEKDFHVLPTEMGKARKKPGENLEFPPFLCYSKERFRGKELGKVLFSLPFFVFLRVYDEEKRNVPARRKAQIERMSQSMTKDMTTGSPAKLILKFTIPLIFGNLFQQFYSMVDTIIVGRYLGKEALAGVGSTGSVNYMIIGFCIGACAGFSIPVAQRFGARHFGPDGPSLRAHTYGHEYSFRYIPICVLVYCDYFRRNPGHYFL